MGGDHAPGANLEGALQALPDLEGELVLVANPKVLAAYLSRRRYRKLAQAIEEGTSRKGCQVRVVIADEKIEMEDSIRAIRSKPGASINVGCRMASEDWKAKIPSAFISAGHSGAMMASALLNMGRIPGAERPAIAVTLPTLSEKGCVLLDVGANVDCKPEHLRDFALMGALFAQADRNPGDLPRVGVLANGEERSKGNELTRAAAILIENHPAFMQGSSKAVGKFLGYSEGKEIFKGSVDVVVTDGFVGNVVLKSLEGLGSAVVHILKKEAKSSPLTIAGFLLSAKVFRNLKRKLDYAEYGAAPLLGVAGYAFICHGRSNAKAVKNALLRTQTAVRSRFVERLEAALAQASQKRIPDTVIS